MHEGPGRAWRSVYFSSHYSEGGCDAADGELMLSQHSLILGGTGSGKVELAQTLLASMKGACRVYFGHRSGRSEFVEVDFGESYFPGNPARVPAVLVDLVDRLACRTERTIVVVDDFDMRGWSDDELACIFASVGTRTVFLVMPHAHDPRLLSYARVVYLGGSLAESERLQEQLPGRVLTVQGGPNDGACRLDLLECGQFLRLDIEPDDMKVSFVRLDPECR